MHFPFDAGTYAARVEEPIAPAALDSEEDQSMDPDDGISGVFPTFFHI